MHHFYEIEVCREKNVSLTSIHQIGIMIFLLCAFLPFCRNDGGIFTSHRTHQIIEITDDQMSTRHIFLNGFEELEEISGQKQLAIIYRFFVVSVKYFCCQVVEDSFSSISANFFCKLFSFQVKLEALFDEIVCFYSFELLLLCIKVYNRKFIIFSKLRVLYYFIMRQIVKHLKKKHEADLVWRRIIGDILIYYLDLLILEKPWIRFLQFGFHVRTQSR